MAALYSSVGFGGGSTYLAILSSTGIPAGWVRWLAYLCNISVTSQNSIRFVKAQWVQWKEAIPWLITSVPMAFIGGMISLEKSIYLKILGITLLISSIFMLLALSPKANRRGFDRKLAQLIGGGVIGFLSGLVGIGGGIFLAPLLHLSSNFSQRKIAGLCSIYILVNSLAGSIGYLIKNGLPSPDWTLFFLIPSVIIGGWLGSKFSIQTKLKNYLRVGTAILIMVVGIRLILNS